MELKAGFLAVSIAGHDKAKIFFIIREEGEYVYLVDGKNRKVSHPKKKKKKHVEPVFTKELSTMEKIQRNQKVTDEEIKHLIRCFKREEQVV